METFTVKSTTILGVRVGKKIALGEMDRSPWEISR